MKRKIADIPDTGGLIDRTTDKLILVSHHLCPYVQRAAISLAEKGVPFERITIDLANKPAWFKAISPLGKVPLLRVRQNGQETVIFESAVILEFLEETEANPLHPADPYARARHRAWIEFGSAILNAVGRFYSAAGEAAFRAESEGLAAIGSRQNWPIAPPRDRGSPASAFPSSIPSTGRSSAISMSSTGSAISAFSAESRLSGRGARH